MAENKTAKQKAEEKVAAENAPVAAVTEEQVKEAEKSADKALADKTKKGDGLTVATEKKFRLRNPNTQYTDIGSGWTIAGTESKPLPESPSAQTFERIKHGFLIED